MTSLLDIYALSAVTVAAWFMLIWWNGRSTEK